ncbi:hypothetical protein PTKIN_Ptkin01aG0246400 [Pterospermum kingtungense]
MAKELNEVWRLLTLMEKEKETVIDGGFKKGESDEEKSRLMAKLLAKRLFNKKAMVNTFKIVWRIVKDFEVMTLDANLFLFKFASLKDKKRVLDGAPWTFKKQFLMLHEYMGDLRVAEYKFRKRLGHGEFECEFVDKDREPRAIKQYGDWLHSLPRFEKGWRGFSVTQGGNFYSVSKQMQGVGSSSSSGANSRKEVDIETSVEEGAKKFKACKKLSLVDAEGGFSKEIDNQREGMFLNTEDELNGETMQTMRWVAIRA